MSGPSPKHPSIRARRNNPKAGFRVLKPEGRQLPAPPWPLQPSPRAQAELESNRDRVASLQVELDGTMDGPTKGRLRRRLNEAGIRVAQRELEIEQARDAEVALWDVLWSTPQAVMWEESHSYRTMLPMYVRNQIAAEQGDDKAAGRAIALSDRLGLNDKALHSLRAEIERAEAAEAQGEQRRRTVPPVPTSKRKKGDDPRNGLFAVS